MPRPALATLAALASTLALAPAASAAAPHDLWATVNVCALKGSQHRMGVRARMPGDGLHNRMFMRFTAQFLNIKRLWTTVSGKGSSPWLYAGLSLYKNQELGYTFSFDAPKPGTGYLMRGVVHFEWRSKKGHVLRRAQRYTQGGHRTRSAVPGNYSSATCRISTPAAK